MLLHCIIYSDIMYMNENEPSVHCATCQLVAHKPPETRLHYHTMGTKLAHLEIIDMGIFRNRYIPGLATFMHQKKKDIAQSALQTPLQ